MYNKRSLGNFSLRKRAYMLIAELCLSLHWFMWLYSYMLWLVVITTVVSRDMDIEFCYINAMTYCQFQLTYETILKFVIKSFVIKYFYGSKELGCAETRKTWWEKLKKKSTQRLMPDKDTLNHICLRANYLAYCQKNFHLSRQILRTFVEYRATSYHCLYAFNHTDYIFLGKFSRNFIVVSETAIRGVL